MICFLSFLSLFSIFLSIFLRVSVFSYFIVLYFLLLFFLFPLFSSFFSFLSLSLLLPFFIAFSLRYFSYSIFFLFYLFFIIKKWNLRKGILFIHVRISCRYWGKIYAANIIHISISEILQGDTKHLIVHLIAPLLLWRESFSALIVLELWLFRKHF